MNAEQEIGGSSLLLPFLVALNGMGKGSTLIRQGEPINLLFFLLEGELAVSIGGKTVAVLKSDEVVGEISILKTMARLSCCGSRRL